MSCRQCGSSLGCDVDCSNAPWNWDRPRRVSRIVYLMRIARWWIGDTRNADRRFSGMTSLRSARLTWAR